MPTQVKAAQNRCASVRLHVPAGTQRAFVLSTRKTGSNYQFLLDGPAHLGNPQRVVYLTEPNRACSTPQNTLAPRKNARSNPFFHPEEGGQLFRFLKLQSFADMCARFAEICARFALRLLLVAFSNRSSRRTDQPGFGKNARGRKKCTLAIFGRRALVLKDVWAKGRNLGNEWVLQDRARFDLCHYGPSEPAEAMASWQTGLNFIWGGFVMHLGCRSIWEGA